MSKQIDVRFGLIALMIVFAAFSRLIPHPLNFTPVGGMALFGAAYFTKKYWAFIIPLVAMFFSDLIINNLVYPAMFPQYYEGFTLMTQGWYWMYGSFALIAALGILALKKVKLPVLIGTSLGASMIFFLITNFGTWASGILYPTSLAGLGMSYAAGLPFFLNTIMGDLFYVGVMFGSFELMKTQYPRLAMQRG